MRTSTERCFHPQQQKKKKTRMKAIAESINKASKPRHSSGEPQEHNLLSPSYAFSFPFFITIVVSRLSVPLGFYSGGKKRHRKELISVYVRYVQQNRR